MHHILLQGVVGSTAYGLAGPDSDIDRLGLYAWPTARLLGLEHPKDTLATHEPSDVTLHEARKFLGLALGGNPTVSELLWLEQYEAQTDLGAELVGIRTAFLCARRVHDAYLGYAEQQFRRLCTRGRFSSDIPERRVAKHARHLMRLVDQGHELYTTGTLRVRLTDPQRYLDFGQAVAADPAAAATFMTAARARFDAARTVLPDTPDTAPVEAWLQRVRRHYYTAEET